MTRIASPSQLNEECHTTNYFARSTLTNYEEATQDIDLEILSRIDVTFDALDWDEHQKTQMLQETRTGGNFERCY